MESNLLNEMLEISIELHKLNWQECCGRQPIGWKLFSEEKRYDLLEPYIRMLNSLIAQYRYDIKSFGYIGISGSKKRYDEFFRKEYLTNLNDVIGVDIPTTWQKILMKIATGALGIAFIIAIGIVVSLVCQVLIPK